MADPNETSPLLAPDNNHDEASGAGNGITSFPEINTYTAARDYFQRPIRAITLRILIISIPSFIVLVATDIFIQFAPFRWHYSDTVEVVRVAEILVALAFIAAVINLRVKLQIWINFIIDIIILLFGFPAWVPVWTSLPPLHYFPGDSWCWQRYYGAPPDAPLNPSPACLNSVLAAKILIGIGGGLAIIIWILHAVLLVTRCVAVSKSGFWRRPLGLTFPTGELTFQFTIKLLRQETGAIVPRAAAGVASSPLVNEEGAP